MRTFDSEFAAHIASGATTLVTCWRIERQDGLVLGFTDHDRTLTFDGVDYAPQGGLNASEVATKLGAATDTSEVAGILQSNAITESDIRLGRYDGAIVETWAVNWRDVAMRERLRCDTIGDITREDGLFRAELRSAQYALNQPKGRRYQALCGTQLGTPECGVDLESPDFAADTTVLETDGAQIKVSGLAGFAADWFVHGSVVWQSGLRIGAGDQIVAQSRTGAIDELTLAAEISGWVQIGDALRVYAGCNRHFETCIGKFANQLNFRGFPHIPGSDFVLRYPKEGDVLSGAPLFT